MKKTQFIVNAAGKVEKKAFYEYIVINIIHSLKEDLLRVIFPL